MTKDQKIIINICQRNKHSGKYQETFYNPDNQFSIAENIHSAFNYMEGDVYAWPADNITKQEVNEQYNNGKHFFYFEEDYTESSVNIIDNSCDAVRYYNSDNISKLKELTDLIDELIFKIEPDSEAISERDPLVTKAIDLVDKYYQYFREHSK